MKSLLIVLAFVVTFGACAASTRERTIQTTFISVQAAEIAFDTFSVQHTADIARNAPDKASGEAQLAAFEAKRNAVRDKLEAAYHLLVAAATVNNDPSVASAVQAATEVMQANSAFGVKIP